MQVVGITTEQEVLVMDTARSFRMNEYLVIEDPDPAFAAVRPLVGEVVETQSYNRFLPFDPERGPVDTSPFAHLRAATGYDVDQHVIHWARVRLLVRLPQPVRPGVPVRSPSFAEVRHLLLRGDPRRSMVLGEILATEDLAPGLDPDLQDRLLVLADGVRPQRGVPFLFDPRAMSQYPHVGIFGGSGSGKSFAMRVLLEEFMKLRIPTLVLDPHYEMNFAAAPDVWPPGRPRFDYSGRFEIFRVGVDVGVRFSDLAPVDLTRLLGAVAAVSEQMVSVVEALHQRGDSYASFAGRLEDLAEGLRLGQKHLERTLATATGHEREVAERRLRALQDYGTLPAASVNGVAWRLRRLERAGLFNHDTRPVEQALKAGRLAVVQGPIWLLQVYASYLLGNLYRQRRDYKDGQFAGEAREYFPPFVVATDEAHNFAPKGYDAPAKAIIKEIAQEGRKYGVFLVLATQRPTLLDETVTAQLNTKLVFRTVRATDIDTIKEETDLAPEEARRLPYLRSGDAFVSSAIFGRTIPVRIRLAETASPHGEDPFDELQQEVAREGEDLLAALQAAGFSRLGPADLGEALRRLERAGLRLSLADLEARLAALAAEGRVRCLRSPFGDQYILPGGD